MEPGLTPEERQEARLTALALVRAYWNDNEENIAVLLADAGERELRAIIRGLMYAVGDSIVRQIYALNTIEDDEARERVENIDVTASAAYPEVRAEIDRQIAALQTTLSLGWPDDGG